MTPVQIVLTVPDEAAPAFRSAVNELSTLVGKRVETPHGHRQERALTLALVGIGKLRAAVNAAIPAGDKSYDA